MTKFPEITAVVNGEEVTWEEINRWKEKRASHVLQEIHDLGGELTFNGKQLDINDIHKLSGEDLIAACKETKLALGQEKIIELYREPVAKTDKLWHDIVEKSVPGKFKEDHVIFHIRGIDPSILTNMNVDQEGGLDLSGAFDLHPEHLVFSQKDNIQMVMETMGAAYMEPSYFRLEMLDPYKSQFADKINPKATRIIFGNCYLANDNFNIQQYAFEQFIPTENGFDVDLGLYTPTAFPDEALIGHREHFSIEFGSLFYKLVLMTRKKNQEQK